MFYVFMLLFETFINRLDRFVLVGRKRLKRRELEQIGVLELFNRMNRVVFFAKLCPEVSELLAILRPLKIIELGIAVVGIGDLVWHLPYIRAIAAASRNGKNERHACAL